MKTKFTLMALTAAVMLSACSNDESDNLTNKGRAAAFTASINGMTRAYDQSWENGDSIGITGTSGDRTYTNVKYITAQGDGNFNVATEGREIYYQDDSTVKFTAYYPWSANASAGIEADTWAQANQKTFDFLWTQATGSKAERNVAFKFSHKMTKVVLTIKKGADVSDEEVKEAVLSMAGFKPQGTFNVTTGLAAATGNVGVMWEFANSNDKTWNAPFVVNEDGSVSYTLLFFPQAFDEKLPFTATLTNKQKFSTDLDFAGANGKAGDKDAKNEWVAGRQYNLSVTLHKTSITVDGCTIVAWNEADGGNVDAE